MGGGEREGNGICSECWVDWRKRVKWSRYDKRSGRGERREKVKGEREEKEKKGQNRKLELTSPGRLSQDLTG